MGRFLLFLAAVALGGCGLSLDFDPPADARAGMDAGVGDGGRAECESDAVCDDGLVCNGAERCDAGVCVSGQAPRCDDGLDCTDDACDEATAGCVFTPRSERCPSVGCAVGVCEVEVGCQLAPMDDACDDVVACTVDRCGIDGECVSLPDDALCGAGEVCRDDGCGPPPSCATDSDCDAPPVCKHGGRCEDGRCLYEEAAEDARCASGDPCEPAFCDGGRCERYPRLDCGPTNLRSCVRMVCGTNGTGAPDCVSANRDGESCVGPDACSPGTCDGATCVAPPQCVAPNACETSTCGPGGFCIPGSRACPPGASCDPLSGSCQCDDGLADCDGDGMCECDRTNAWCDGSVCRPYRACSACGGAASECCPCTGICFDPRCLACCMFCPSPAMPTSMP